LVFEEKASNLQIQNNELAEQYDEEIEKYIRQQEELNKAAQMDADKIARLQAKCMDYEDLQTRMSKIPIEIKAEPKACQPDSIKLMETSVLTNSTNE